MYTIVKSHFVYHLKIDLPNRNTRVPSRDSDANMLNTLEERSTGCDAISICEGVKM